MNWHCSWHGALVPIYFRYTHTQSNRSNKKIEFDLQMYELSWFLATIDCYVPLFGFCWIMLAITYSLYRLYPPTHTRFNIQHSHIPVNRLHNAYISLCDAVIRLDKLLKSPSLSSQSVYWIAIIVTHCSLWLCFGYIDWGSQTTEWRHKK